MCLRRNLLDFRRRLDVQTATLDRKTWRQLHSSRLWEARGGFVLRDKLGTTNPLLGHRTVQIGMHREMPSKSVALLIRRQPGFFVLADLSGFIESSRFSEAVRGAERYCRPNPPEPVRDE